MLEPVKISRDIKLMIKRKALELTEKTGKTVTIQHVTEQSIRKGIDLVGDC